MSVVETLVRILARFPKLLIAIVKRCSSTTLHLLQYIFSFRNASVQKSQERKHFLKSNVDNTTSLSTTPIFDIEKGGEVEAGASVGRPTILCSPGGGPSSSPTIPTTDAKPADGEGSRGHMPQEPISPPALGITLREMFYMTWKLSSMFSTLDYPGNIARMLQVARRSKPEQNRATRQCEATQEDDQSRDRERDVDEWIVFCHIFQEDLKNASLLVSLV